MRKFILGSVAALALASPLAMTASAHAADLTPATLSAPTVGVTVGHSNAGTPQYGASTGGTWKLGSKTTLDSGAEFATHGGSNSSGPVTRYRLVFTPDATHTLPSLLPAGSTVVSGSAVYFVYAVDVAYNDSVFGPVHCAEAQGAGVENVVCSFDGDAHNAGESGVVGWNSDFDGTGGGTLTYKVNAAGTGYTGKVTY